MPAPKVEYEVLDICPAEFHNTLRAALGRDRENRKRDKCICDRARALLAKERARKRGRKDGSPARKPGRPKGSLDLDNKLLALPVGKVPRPDFSQGVCATPSGQKAMESYLDNGNVPAARAAARAVCLSGCSIRRECAAWIVDFESRMGSQMGIYAGFTQSERERATRERKAGLDVQLL